MEPPPVLLKLVNLSKSFDAAENVEPVHVLRGITLDIARGESLAVIGPSGSGKSTLLNIIGTLDQPTSGQVLLEGKDLNQFDDRQLAVLRNQQIGFVFQAHYLLPQCSVLENVLVPTLATRNNSQKSGEDRARQLLERVGLGRRLTHRPGQLSGGERQRVAVVRALINQPKILLADEPTGALDRHSAQEMAELLAQLNREQNVTLLLVTHALDLAHRMGRVLELRDGALTPVEP